MRQGLMGLGLGLLVASGLFETEALAKKGGGSEGVVVTVKVLDGEGKPIPTAVIRHPQEAERHRVNTLTGEWYAQVLYLPDGSELIFQPGSPLSLEVSAPGFMTKIIQYDIRKRNNKVEIALDKLQIDEDEIEEPLLQFGRDRPREDGGGSGPAN